MIFDNHFSVVWKNGSEEIFDYFLFEDIPVINYVGRSRSICGKLPIEGWEVYESSFPVGTPAIFLKLEEEDVINWCSVYHEMGHIQLGHLDEEHPEDRLSGVDQGIVDRLELEADNFAVTKMGKENVIYWLEYLNNFLSRNIDMFEQHEASVGLNETGQYNLSRLKLSKKEVLLRIKNVINS